MYFFSPFSKQEYEVFNEDSEVVATIPLLSPQWTESDGSLKIGTHCLLTVASVAVESSGRSCKPKTSSSSEGFSVFLRIDWNGKLLKRRQACYGDSASGRLRRRNARRKQCWKRLGNG